MYRIKLICMILKRGGVEGLFSNTEGLIHSLVKTKPKWEWWSHWDITFKAVICQSSLAKEIFQRGQREPSQTEQSKRIYQDHTASSKQSTLETPHRILEGRTGKHPWTRPKIPSLRSVLSNLTTPITTLKFEIQNYPHTRKRTFDRGFLRT